MPGHVDRVARGELGRRHELGVGEPANRGRSSWARLPGSPRRRRTEASRRSGPAPRASATRPDAPEAARFPSAEPAIGTGTNSFTILPVSGSSSRTRPSPPAAASTPRSGRKADAYSPASGDLEPGDLLDARRVVGVQLLVLLGRPSRHDLLLDRLDLVGLGGVELVRIDGDLAREPSRLLAAAIRLPSALTATP